MKIFLNDTWRTWFSMLMGLVVFSVGCGAGAASVDDALTFRASFDGTVEAEAAPGGGAPEIKGTVKFADGVFGKALEVGETGATLTFPSKGNLPLEKGTVEMWLLPVKWNMAELNRYDAHHIFFRAQDANGWFQIYKFDKNLFWCVRGKNSDYATLQGLITYEAVIGRWVHLVTTWDGDDVRQYVNGQEFEKKLKPMPALPAKFEIGDIEFAGTTPGGRKPMTTLMDELRIYNRPLTAGEILSRFAAGITALAPKGRPSIDVPGCAAAPKIDGRSAAGEWDKASLLRGFRAADGKTRGEDGIGVDPELSVAVSHDDTNLYLAFQRKMEAGVTLESAPREHDADLRQDDSVVVELAPDWNGAAAPAEWRRFEVNLSGCRADAKIGADGKVDATWNPAWQAAASAENLDRVMELAIPFASLGRSAPKGKERWAVRLASRAAIAGGAKYELFWGGRPSGTEPKGWGQFTLRPDATAVQIESLRCSRKGEVAVSAKLIPNDPALVSTLLFAEAPGSTVQGLLLSKNSSTYGTPNLPAGKATPFAVAGRIGDQSAPFIETGMIDRRTGELIWYDQFAINLEKGALLDLTLRPTLGIGQLSVSIQGAGIDPVKTPILIELLNVTTGKAEFSTELTTFTDMRAAVELPIRNLAPGDYVVRSSVTLPGADKPSIKEFSFVKPQMPWIGNAVGILDDQHVPEPWTPLMVAQKEGTTTVSCWGREFVFNGSPLPVQIRSQGADLLASPAVIIGTKAGAVTEWKGSGFVIEKATPAKVSFKGTASLGGSAFSVKGCIEYDGMMWLEVDGDLAKADFDQLSFILPMRKEVASYRLVADSVYRNSGAWKSGLVHSVWFGSESAGLSWFTESDKDWKTVPTVTRLELAPAGDAIVFRVNLVSGGTAGAKGRFEFGLNPTPTRPMPENWRRQAINSVNAWVGPWEMRYHGYPQLPAGDEGVKGQEKLRRMASIWRASGGCGIPYLHSCMLSSASPEWSYFNAEWRNPGNIYPYVPKGEAIHPGLYGVCPASEGWTDFDVFTIRDYLLRTDLDGVYHDFGSPSICSNELHGCRGGMPIRAYRELHKRLYVMQHELGQERGRATWYMHHTSICSGLIIPSIVSFAESIADSEQLGGQLPRLGQDMFIRQVPLEYYRIRGSAKPFGVANNFIINRGPVLPANYAMCLVHDIVSQFGGEGWQIWQLQLRPPLLRFGLADEDIQFRGYWEGRGGATVTGAGLTTADVLMSLYVKPGKRALAIMVNRDTKPRSETLSFDWKSLGVPEGSPVTDLLTGEVVAAGKDGYPVKLDGLGARYLVAGAMPPATPASAPGDAAARWGFRADGTVHAESGMDALDFAAFVRGRTAIVEGRTLGAKALRLDGKSCMVQTPKGGELAVYNGKALTLTAWIKPETVKGRSTLLALLDGDGIDVDNKKGKARLAVEINDGRLGFSYLATDGKLKSGETDPVLSENAWQHVAVTFKDDGKAIGLWLDGKLLKKFATDAPAVQLCDYWSYDFLFGKKSYDTSVEDGFKGDVGEVRLFAHVLAEDDMRKDALP